MSNHPKPRPELIASFDQGWADAQAQTMTLIEYYRRNRQLDIAEGYMREQSISRLIVALNEWLENQTPEARAVVVAAFVVEMERRT